MISKKFQKKKKESGAPSLVRCSKHVLSDSNIGKRHIIFDLLKQAKIATQFYIDYYWNEVIKDENGNIVFDLKNDILDFPTMPNRDAIGHQKRGKSKDETSFYFQNKLKLSSRMLGVCVSQASDAIRSRVKQRDNLLKIIKKRKAKSLPVDYFEKKLLHQDLLTSTAKPCLKEFSLNLCSNNAKIIKMSKGHFDYFIKIYSSGFPIIYLPLRLHKQAKKWVNKGDLLSGILLKEECIQINWQLPKPPLKTEGATVGGDTGQKDIVNLSDKQVSPQTNKHGHSLSSIMNSLSRKKKGSKNFEQAQNHRKDFINWSINQLNLSAIKQINLEKVSNIFNGKKRSRFLGHWTNSDIQKKILNIAEEQGVLVNLKPSAFASQRCSACGVLRKSNRKGKNYCCKICGFKSDADLNAALNHEQDLYSISFEERQIISSKKLNLSGRLYWRPEGLFLKDETLSGEELPFLAIKNRL